ncbi:hypothetical protein sce2364 [Sorangium cellulosum So ce56]|uniref:Outer membrane lipoprotein BamD-like domain-containing protein n=1 Tax=Sorangium cellulosum (strain So ce56) TaxID=448385 RepID=A9G1L5_SORC5|nr:hypothetical protein [Sorangium cellulosum]CAN92523.1 hypothetical protein sce2364 [Sorangium cellulosum So ce56]
MSDPKRWNQEGGGAPPGARELLRAAAPIRPMTSAELARTAARVAPLETAAGAAAGATMPAWIKGIFLAAGIGAGGAGLHAALGEAPSAAAPPPVLTDLPLERLLSRAEGRAAAGSPSAEAPSAEAPRPPPSALRREAPPSPRPAAPALEATAAADGDDLVRESNLVDASRAALAQDPGAALAALERHQAEFPKGRLAEEREFIAIRALVRLGRADEARARAAAFFARYPSSSFAEPLRRIVGAAR